ncbi:MAG: hypothetical protein RIE08_16735 [Acidimicrobiales bacterium]
MSTPVLALLVAVVALSVAGCRDARRLDDVQVDAVRVGSDDVLSEAESRFVARTDGRNADIRAALVDFFDAFEAGDVPSMSRATVSVTVAVDDFVTDLEAQSDPAVVATYAPYEPVWGRVIEALVGMRTGVEFSDLAAIEASARLYDRSIGEITALDAVQVERLRPVLGDEQLRRLLEQQGVDPAIFGLTGRPAA